MTAGVRASIEHRGLAPFGALAGVSWDVSAGIRSKQGVLSWPERSRLIKRHDDPSGDYWVRFLELAELEGPALERAVGSFARRWGPLYLCEAHGLPTTHPWHVTPGARASASSPMACRVRFASGRKEEPVERWRELARQAAAVLMARADLRDGEPVPSERFDAMMGALPLGMTAPGVSPRPLGLGRRVTGPLGSGAIGPITLRLQLSKNAAIGTAVQQWLAMSDVGPQFNWEDGDFALSFESRSLFGALALRMAGNLTDVRALVKCAYGNHWYQQTRRGTYFCRSEECDRLRLAENQRRRRAGQARRYAPRSD
jgi:hypothetical protein